jgi:methionine-rich copper-binding protein CopC
MSLSRKLVVLVLMATAPLLACSSALAHAKLVRSDPAPKSTVAAPKIIKLTFSEKVAPAFSGFTVSMGDAMTVNVTAKVGEDGKTVIGTPTGPFMAGTYKLSWHAVAADDGHRTEGSYSFTVK